jgi:hypothetical protein
MNPSHPSGSEENTGSSLVALLTSIWVLLKLLLMSRLSNHIPVSSEMGPLCSHIPSFVVALVLEGPRKNWMSSTGGQEH